MRVITRFNPDFTTRLLTFPTIIIPPGTRCGSFLEPVNSTAATGPILMMALLSYALTSFLQLATKVASPSF